VKSSLSVIVTRIEPQRHVALRDSAKEEGSWEFGLPVRVEGSTMMSCARCMGWWLVVGGGM
jgi:hypothetical protein